MFIDVIDKKRKNLLPCFKPFKKNYYLAGGTALALQIGHRESVDFDFFSEKDIDTVHLFADIKQNFAGNKILKIQEEKNTLTVTLDGEIKMSFFAYKYPLIKKPIVTDFFRLASIADIGCMKLAAILGRSSFRDFVDIFYILHQIPLNELLLLAKNKFSDTDINLFLKSLVYFDEVEEEPIKFLNKNKVSFKKIKAFLISAVRKYSNLF